MPTDTTEKDFMTMLDEELKSSCTTKIPDTRGVPIEDVIRDIHRVLNGNGGPTKGLVFKMAVNSVYTKQVRSDLTGLSAKLDAQVARCNEVQRLKAEEARVMQAELKTVSRIGQALWDNKALILVLIISVISYMGNRSLVASSDSRMQVNSALIEQVVEQALDVKLQALKPITPPPSKPAYVKPH